MKKILKIALILFSVFFLFLFGALLLLKFYFPAEKIRLLAQKELSDILKDEVRINSLELTLTRGFEAEDISIGGEKGPAHVHKIFFFYDWNEILKGRLVINKVGVERPVFFIEKKEGRWNFERYLAPPEEAPATPKKPSLPALPFPLHLQSFEINGLSLKVRTKDYHLEWEGVDLTASLDLSGQKIGVDLDTKGDSPSTMAARFTSSSEPSNEQPVSFSLQPHIQLQVTGNNFEAIGLRGSVGFNNMRLEYGNDSLSTRASFSLDMDLNAVDGHANLRQATINLFDENSVNISGRITNLFDEPAVNLVLKDTSLQIASFLPFSRPFFPSFAASGTLKTDAFHLETVTDKNKNITATTGGSITLHEISVQDKNRNAEIKKISGSINLERAAVDPSGDLSGSMAMGIQAEKGKYGENRFQNLAWEMSPTSFDVKDGIPHSLQGIISANLQSAFMPGAELENMKGRIDLNISEKSQGEIIISSAVEAKIFDSANKMEISTPIKMDLAMGLTGENFNRIAIEGKTTLGKIHLQREKLKGTTSITITPKISANLAEKKMILHSLDVSLPGKNRLNVKGSISALENIRAKMEASGLIAPGDLKSLVSGFLPNLTTGGEIELKKVGIVLEADPLMKHFTVQTDGSIKMKNIKAAYRDMGSIKGFGGDLSWNAAGLNEKGIENLTGNLEGKFSLSDGNFFVKPMELSINHYGFHSTIKAKYKKGKAAFSGKLKLKSEGLSSVSHNWQSPPLNLFTSFQAESNIPKQTHSLNNFSCSVKGVTDLKLSGKFAEKTKSFESGMEILELDLGQVTKFIPPSMLKSIPAFKTKGKIGVALQARGKIPGEEDLKLFPRKPLPLSAACDIKVNNVDFALTDQDMEANSVKGPVEIRYGKGKLDLVSRISIDRVNLKKIMTQSLSLKTDTDIHVEEPDRIKINKLNLSIPEFGFTESLSGEFSGLAPFLAKELEPNLKNILNKVFASLTGKTSFQSPDPLPVMKGANIRGASGLEFLVSLVPEKEFSVQGKADFNNLSAEYNHLASVENLSGHVPFDKKLLFKKPEKPNGKSGGKYKAGPATLNKNLFPHLRTQEKLTMESARVFGHEISQIRLEPSFKEDAINLDRFSFKVLGGYAVGRLGLESGEKQKNIRMRLEFAGIDSGLLLKKDLNKRSTVNGNMVIHIPLSGTAGSEAMNVGMMGIEINITKIGEEVLDRLLLFIDPRESNPSIVNLRSKLKLAIPVSANIKLKHGALSVSTQLKLLAIGGGLHQIDALERVPVSRISGFQKIDSLMEQVQSAARILNLVFASDIRMDENGKITLDGVTLIQPEFQEQKNISKKD